MGKEEKYCPLTKICKFYDGCSHFYNGKWIGCTNFNKLRDFFMNLIYSCLEDAESEIKNLNSSSNFNKELIKLILKYLPDDIKDNIKLQFRKGNQESLII